LSVRAPTCEDTVDMGGSSLVTGWDLPAQRASDHHLTLAVARQEPPALAIAPAREPDDFETITG